MSALRKLQETAIHVLKELENGKELKLKKRC